MKIYNKIYYYVIFIIFYILSLIILWFWGQFQFEFFLGYLFECIGYIFLIFYIFKGEIKNKVLKSPYLLICIFFLIRIIFMFKIGDSLSTDFQFYYESAIKMLNHQIPFLDFPSYYGPVFYVILYIPAIISNGNYYFIKFFFILIDFGCIIVSYFLLKLLKIKNFYKFLYIYIFSPIIFVEFGWKLHNDTGAILFVLISIYFLVKKKYIFSSIIILLSCLYKFYSIFLIPFFILYIYKIYPNFKSKIKNILFFLAIYIVSIIIIFLTQTYSLIYNIFYIHFQRDPWGSFAQMVFDMFLNNYAYLVLTIFFNLIYLLLYPKLTINQKIYIIIFNFVSSILSFIVPVPLGSIFIIPFWLIFIKYKEIKINKVAIFLNILAASFCLLNFIYIEEIFLQIYSYVFFLIMLGVYGYIFIFFYKSKIYTDNIFILTIIFSLSIFLTFFWVQFPWYLLWVLPIILIFYNKNWIYRFIIIIAPFFSPLIIYRDIGFFEGFVGPYIGSFINFLVNFIILNYIFRFIVLIAIDIIVIFIFIKNILKVESLMEQKFLKIIIILLLIIAMIVFGVLGEYESIFLFLSVCGIPLFLFLYIFSNYLFKFIIKNYKYPKLLTNIILIFSAIYLLRSIWYFNIITSIFSIICVYLLCNFILQIRQNKIPIISISESKI